MNKHISGEVSQWSKISGKVSPWLNRQRNSHRGEKKKKKKKQKSERKREKEEKGISQDLEGV